MQRRSAVSRGMGRNSDNYTLFQERSVVAAQTVDNLNGVTFKSRSLNYSEGEGVRSNNTYTPLSESVLRYYR